MIRLALGNPYLIIVVVLIVFVVGMMSYMRIPADLLPTFETSAVQIVCFYPGMPPEVMEQDIMTRLQRWSGQSAGIEHQEAKAMQGVCIVKDFFHEGVTSAEALSQVSMYAMSDLFYLPPGTIPPMVMPFDPTASVPLCLVTVSNPEMTEKDLYDIAYKNLRNNLQSISGVIAPAVYGGKLRRILAYVDPDKLKAYGLSIMEVHAALKRQNVLIPAGSAKIGNTDFQIFTNAMPETVELLNQAPIRTGADGQMLRFRDIGEVKDSAQIQTNKVRVNGRTLVYIPIYRQPGSNTIEIVKRIRTELGEILARLKEERRDEPAMQSLTLNLVMDQSVIVAESIRALQLAAVLGAVLAGLVVLLFLRNWRSTLIVVLAIPVSILAALIGLYFTGNTINAMTLGGLALAVGILVDQAIVVLDNIERHVRMGTDRTEAAYRGAQEVAMPLLVSSMTFVVVFFPVIFLSGLAKFLFTPLALAVLFAIGASYLIAVFFVPVASSRLLRITSKEEAATSHDPVMERVLARYQRLLWWCLDRKKTVLAGSAVAFVGALGLLSITGRELFPPVESGQFTIYVRADSGTRIEETERIIRQIENTLVDEIGDPAPDNPEPYAITLARYDADKNGRLDAPEVAAAKEDSNCRLLISNIGVLMDWPAAYTPNTGPMDAFVLVQLVGKSAAPDVFEYVTRLRQRLNREFPSVEFAFDTGGILTAALNMGEPSPIHLQITGHTMDVAQRVADRLIETIRQVPGATDVRKAQRNDYPIMRVEIDRHAAIDRGVTVDEVMKALVASTNSSINFDPAFWIDPRNGNHYFLGTQYYEEKINSLDTLKYIAVKGTTSASRPSVFLQDVAHFNYETGPSVINHRNIKRVTDVYANVEPGYDLGSVVQGIEAKLTGDDHPLKLTPVKDSRSAAAQYPVFFQNILAAVGLNRPTKYAIGGEAAGKGFTLEMQGEIRSMRDSFVDFTLGLVLATVLVYLVMVAQFRSFLDPIVVMVAVPLGFIGVALILFLTGTRLNIQSFMGMIMMTGIVVEYTIVLLDFANRRVQEGADAMRAILDATSVRFRPILMTSITTILALTPMAIGFAGSEADAPLARTIVGGVIAATLLPMFVVPCLYVMVKRKVVSG